jgi:hypothetical protein
MRTSAAVTALPAHPRETTRKLVLPFDDINAWLDRRLRLWLDSQRVELPAEIGPVVVAGKGDHLVLAFAVDHPRVKQVFSLDFEFTVMRDDRAVVKLVGVRGGRLPIPFNLALRELPQSVRKAVPPDALSLVERARQGLAFDPVFRIDSMRRVRVLSAELTDEAVVLIVRQERAR